MSVTIKKIAEISGVSRGTVDRVLNNRGKVSEAVERKVRETAQRLGYTPNMAGKALSIKKKEIVIGSVLPSEGNPFFYEIMRGMIVAANELSDYGVRLEIKKMRGYDPEKQERLIDEFSKRIDILLITPVDDDRIREKIDALAECGVPTITLNSDICDSKRVCYVGSDYFKGGEIACGMLAMATGGRANLGIIMGSSKVLGHSQRLDGFMKILRQRFPDIRVTGTTETEDDDIIAFDRTRKLLERYPQTNALFIVAAGVYGACRAVIDNGVDKDICVVTFDDVPSTVEMMERGLVRATICQQPFTQGYEAVKIAFDYYLGKKVPADGIVEIENEIKIMECF